MHFKQKNKGAKAPTIIPLDFQAYSQSTDGFPKLTNQYVIHLVVLVEEMSDHNTLTPYLSVRRFLND